MTKEQAFVLVKNYNAYLKVFGKHYLKEHFLGKGERYKRNINLIKQAQKIIKN